MTSRALVLSGGGPVGIAWESGLLGGFAKAGVDLSQADFIMGTSAGSFVGARLAMGVTPEALEAHARTRLANYKIPKRFVLCADLPLLPIGKVDKIALKAKAREQFETASA